MWRLKKCKFYATIIRTAHAVRDFHSWNSEGNSFLQYIAKSLKKVLHFSSQSHMIIVNFAFVDNFSCHVRNKSMQLSSAAHKFSVPVTHQSRALNHVCNITKLPPRIWKSPVRSLKRVCSVPPGANFPLVTQCAINAPLAIPQAVTGGILPELLLCPCLESWPVTFSHSGDSSPLQPSSEQAEDRQPG